MQGGNEATRTTQMPGDAAIATTLFVDCEPDPDEDAVDLVSALPTGRPRGFSSRGEVPIPIFRVLIEWAGSTLPNSRSVPVPHSDHYWRVCVYGGEGMLLVAVSWVALDRDPRRPWDSGGS